MTIWHGLAVSKFRVWTIANGWRRLLKVKADITALEHCPAFQEVMQLRTQRS